MNFSRKLQIDRLEQKNKYELLVIGGGIVGAAVLEMASAKDIDSILLEKNDFSSGASSRRRHTRCSGVSWARRCV